MSPGESPWAYRPGQALPVCQHPFHAPKKP
jgi:hypothetical protein